MRGKPSDFGLISPQTYMHKPISHTKTGENLKLEPQSGSMLPLGDFLLLPASGENG